MRHKKTAALLCLALAWAFLACPAMAASPARVESAAIADAYRTWAAPHLKAGASSPLDLADEGPENHDGIVREMMDLTNFARACSGVSPVSEDPGYSALAQAGVDFLRSRGLANDHHAADGIDEQAAKGLQGSNLASGTSGYLGPARAVFGLIADKQAGNMKSTGHRRWLLDDTRHRFGAGWTDDGTTARGAVFAAGDQDAAPGAITACPAAGDYPIDIFRAAAAETPVWSVMLGGGWEPSMSVPDGGAGVCVTVTRDDGQTASLSYSPEAQASGDWWTVPDSLGYGSGGGLTLYPGTFASGGLDALAGRTFTVRITGLSGGDGTVEYQTRFVRLEDVLSEGQAAPQQPQPVPEEAPSPAASGLSYAGHVQDIGWMDPVCDGQTAGTEGRALRLEALNIRLPQGVEGGISARAHLADIGWTDCPAANGETIGTVGEGRRMEALSLALTGPAAERYSIAYRTHVENIGWTPWAMDGEVSGTTGQALRAEAFQAALVPKQ